MRFKKIKISKEGKVSMEYEIKNTKGGSDEFSFSCSDEPKPSFVKALRALEQDALEMCELPKDYLSRIRVTGVSLSYGGENETMGAVLVAQMILNHSNVNLNLNTTHKTEDYYGETGDPQQLLDRECVRRINDLMNEAEDYVRGIRAQQNLFDPLKQTSDRKGPFHGQRMKA